MSLATGQKAEDLCKKLTTYSGLELGRTFQCAAYVCTPCVSVATGQKAKDLRNWLTIYSYWNQGGRPNVVAMFAHLVDQYFKPTGASPAKLLETPATG